MKYGSHFMCTVTVECLWHLRQDIDHGGGSRACIHVLNKSCISMGCDVQIIGQAGGTADMASRAASH